MRAEPASVVVTGDSSLVRAAVASSLERSGFTVSTVEEPGRVLDVDLARIDAVVSCVGHGVEPLLRLLPKLLAHSVGVLVVHASDSEGEVSELLFAGASGSISLEESTSAELAAAAGAVAAGHAALHPSVAMDVLQRWRQTREPERTRRSTNLTSREVDVLRVLARGEPTKVIARALSMAPRTVETHRAHIYTKLGARNQAEAVRIAVDLGLLRPDRADDG